MTGTEVKTVIWELVCFWGRIIGTCAVFYVFFLKRMLGAGDIKLMAICVGILGIRTGAYVIFLGMLAALAGACIKGCVWKHGWLMIRNMELRLAPYLLAGYVVFHGLCILGRRVGGCV